MSQNRAVIIYNPMSGRAGRRAEDARQMIELLHVRGVEADSCATTGPGDATRLAREAVAGGAEIIVCYGGDGTLNEVIQSLAGTRAALAIWPGGTSNVAARDIGVPSRMVELADMIAAGKTRRVALGLVQLLEPHREMSGGEGEKGSRGAEEQGSKGTSADLPRSASPPLPGSSAASRYFLMMAGIGLDASIAAGVNAKLKRRAGELAYWLAGIRHLFTWQADRFEITVDGRRFESAFAIIGKGAGYGGGMRITPHARLEEPLFEVYILPPQKRNLDYLRVLAACMRGKPETTGATMIKGKRVEANSSDAPWVEADGEVIGRLPMTFEVAADALTLIVP